MATLARTASNHAVRGAVHQHAHLTKAGLLERAFTFAFRGLVYPQIWEDPRVDLEALALTPDCHVVTIASGSCNVLSYLTAGPRAITAVDLNPAHVALGQLKLAAIRHLPGQPDFHRFFAEADRRDNFAAYRTHLRPHLDPASRAYWDGRDLAGRRRIGGFARCFYKRGLLGLFIAIAHGVARLHGVDPRVMLTARDRAEQRRLFETKLAPLFDKPLVRFLTDQPATLFGLGIPPAQYVALAGDDPDGIAGALRARLEKLACDFDLADNYFAWQAFGRGYGKHTGAPLPPYLQPDRHAALVEGVDRVEIRHANMVDYLASMPAGSLDRYVLLDAQDWMTDAQLTALWTQITRTAKPGARVLFRTAAVPDLLPGRVPDSLLGQWRYAAAESADFTRRDRSAVYGGVHLYRLAPAA